MTHNIDFDLASSEEIERVLARRLEAIRLARNITQSQLAKEAGVSRSTMTRLAQADKGLSLNSFIRILKALHLHNQLETLLPDPGISPLRQLQGGHVRQRARAKKTTGGGWTWDDDEADV